MCWKLLWEVREGYIYLLVCLYIHTHFDFISRNCFRGFPFSYRTSPSNALLPAMQTNWQISPTASLVPSWDTYPVSLPVCPQHGYPAVSLPRLPQLRALAGSNEDWLKQTGEEGLGESCASLTCEQGSGGHLIRDGKINTATSCWAHCGQRQ